MAIKNIENIKGNIKRGESLWSLCSLWLKRGGMVGHKEHREHRGSGALRSLCSLWLKRGGMIGHKEHRESGSLWSLWLRLPLVVKSV